MTITASAAPTAALATPGPLAGDEQAAALAYFAAKLAHETDASDVRAAQLAGEEFTLVDVRGDAPWRQGRLPGAIHLPHAQIAERAADLIPLDRPVVVYCWGPGCNGGSRGALAFAKLGYRVREMIGGFEYWAREGYGIVDDAGTVPIALDPLTNVRPGADLEPEDCGC